MARTNTMKNALATSYGQVIYRVSLHTADPGSTGASEVTGGSPAYARVAPPTITAPTTGLVTFQVSFNVPAGATVAGAGLWDSSGNFLDGGTVTSQTFATQGVYTLTVSCQAN